MTTPPRDRPRIYPLTVYLITLGLLVCVRCLQGKHTAPHARELLLYRRHCWSGSSWRRESSDLTASLMRVRDTWTHPGQVFTCWHTSEPATYSGWIRALFAHRLPCNYIVTKLYLKYLRPTRRWQAGRCGPPYPLLLPCALPPATPPPDRMLQLMKQSV